MVRTESTMLPLGTSAPNFSLPDAYGKTVSLSDFSGKPLLIMFISNHCPYVKHVREQLAAIGKDYEGKLDAVAVGSNDVELYPDDAPEYMQKDIEEFGYNFPYLYDESQGVAKAYAAACTPDFFLFDANHELFYRGQLDDSRPKTDLPVTGKDLRAAIDAAIAGEDAPTTQYPSLGCNIKWKEGNAPAYFAGA